MNLWQILLVIFLLSFWSMVTASKVLESTNSGDNNTTKEILYPKSSVDLIVNFFKTYKHIKRLTLFLCDDSSTHLSISIPSDYYNPILTGAKVQQEQQQKNNEHPKLKQKYANGGLNYQQIVKYLMDAGNFLIKGDGNIDATMFNITSSNECNIDVEYEKLNSFDAYRLSGMLERGDSKQGVVLDSRCHHSQFILQQASECGLFNTSYHWMILEQPLAPMSLLPPSPPSSSSFSSSSTPLQPSSSAKLFSFGVEFFERLNINMNSEITLVKPQQSNSETNSTAEWNIYDLYDVWNPGNIYGGKLNVSHMGTYSADEQFLNISFKETTIIRRLNVHGIKIRAMAVVTNPFNETFEEYLDHTHNPHLDSMNRFNYRLLTYVRDMFNFRIKVYRTNSWGYLKNGTFDGMIGALVRGSVDVGASPIFFRSERAKVIDYTARTWISRPCFVFRHPTGLVRNVFLQPFTVNVWYCIIIVGIVVIGATSFISKREKRISGATMKVESKMTTTMNRSRKLKRNDGAMQSQQQIRRRHQTSDSMLNTVQLKQHEASMTEPETQLRCDQQIPTHIISGENVDEEKNENVVIGICAKVFRKCFFSTRCSPVSVNQKSVHLAELTKVQQTMNGKRSHKKINHENFRLNVYEYYLGAKNDENGFTSGDAVADAAVDRGHNITVRYKHGNVNSKPTKTFDNIDVEYDESALSRCTLLFIGALCQQGSAEMPQFTSRRCIIMLILLFGFCTFQFYSASIVGSLLMEKPKTIKTLRNLIDSPLKLGIEDIVYNKDFFKRTTDAVALELYEKKVKVVNPKTGDISYNFMPPRDGLFYVRQGGFAFHADTATFYKIIIDEFSERSICELSEIQLFPEQHMMAIVQKGSPLRKMITYGLRRTFEHGLLYHERKRWHSPKPQCVRQIQPEDLEVYTCFHRYT
ncbi:uncharacterized protein LOC116345713 isoform X2 [Contarinia nasturtii]|uniref:uncharacterized protein LOC116345713 isoform X2 n=1 Tax=Contarinia nasturtii TaxID=265458 RepID=UPI0012D3E2E0|nr:uncharacterized protein LOC116345713 isoform X2 [Contarinia nasturtii]